MIKVLHLTISSDFGGGPEHIYQLIKGMNHNVEAHIACPENGHYFVRFCDITLNRYTKLPFRKFDPWFLFSLLRYIKFHKIELLHAHGKGAGIYCRFIRVFLKIAVVHTPHGINQKIESGFINKIYVNFERFFSFGINSIIYVSQTELDYGNSLNIWPNVPTSLIYNGTPIISISQKIEWREKKRNELDLFFEKIIITASRFDFQKNTIEFCQIASKLPEVTFIVIGDGEFKNDCEDFCKNSGIKNVLFKGNVTDPLKYFAASDIYLSTSRWEGLSMAILESMSLGLPVVATDVIGNRDLVKTNITGFTYKPGDLNSAAYYLNYLLNPDVQDKFSFNAKKLHNLYFSADAMCAKTYSLYQDILNKS
jgi:glycosyltransferase involved in cell wall biosynthesis